MSTMTLDAFGRPIPEEMSDTGMLAEALLHLRAQAEAAGSPVGSFGPASTERHPVALLNTSIATVPGRYEIRAITLEHARMIVHGNDIFPAAETISAIGHQATADALTELLGIDVPVNRITFEQQAGQMALVLKLRGRLPEGVILDRAALDEVGFDLWLMTRLAEA